MREGKANGKYNKIKVKRIRQKNKYKIMEIKHVFVLRIMKIIIHNWAYHIVTLLSSFLYH